MPAGAHILRQNEQDHSWFTLNMQLGQILHLISQDSHLSLKLEDRPKEFIERHLMQIAKLHLTMAKNYPAASSLLAKVPRLEKERSEGRLGLSTLFVQILASHSHRWLDRNDLWYEHDDLATCTGLLLPFADVRMASFVQGQDQSYDSLGHHIGSRR